MIGLYTIATGRLESLGSEMPDPLPSGMATAPVPEGGTAFVTHTWDAATASWVVLVSPTATQLSVLQFKARFTQTERDRIEIAQVDHPERLVRARLRLIEKDMESARDKQIDRRDPRTQAGVGYLATVIFEGAPLLTSARVVEIIGADAL